jgi:hypothetical protein
MPQENYLYLTQTQHEEVSTGFLVQFRDAQLEKIASGQLDPNEPCGAQSSLVEELLFCFFDENRDKAGIHSPSSMMTTEALAEYINVTVLPRLAEYRPDLLTLDWQGQWQLRDSDIDFNSVDGDDDLMMS